MSNAQDEVRVFLRLLDPFDVLHRVALLSDLQNWHEWSWAMSLRHEGTSSDYVETEEYPVCDVIQKDRMLGNLQDTMTGSCSTA